MLSGMTMSTVECDLVNWICPNDWSALRRELKKRLSDRVTGFVRIDPRLVFREVVILLKLETDTSCHVDPTTLYFNIN